jgi:hypothetical protein
MSLRWWQNSKAIGDDPERFKAFVSVAEAHRK